MQIHSLPQLLYRIAKKFFSQPHTKFDTVREAMIEVNSAWQRMQETVKQRLEHARISNASINLIATLLQFTNDLQDGIGKFDVGLPSDDLIRGTKMAMSPCCSQDSKFIGILPVNNGIKWRMLCNCGKEWLL